MNAMQDYDDPPMLSVVPPAVPAMETTPLLDRDDEPLPLPRWLVAVYFIFPIILYIPDAIFNYYVYSDGAYIPNAALPLQISQTLLWGFLAIGVVGMAYLLSVLAPWHWTNGHHLQAAFCWIGVLVATGITIWNSLSYRSGTFKEFATDKWLYAQFPQLADQHISFTMILVALAPPFWGLFWALVQPTQRRRSLAHLNQSHQEKVLRLHQEAEMKRLRAEANARVREAQLKGMAQTAAAARQQAGTLFTRKNDAAPAANETTSQKALAPQVAPRRVASSPASSPATPQNGLPTPPPQRAQPTPPANPPANPYATFSSTSTAPKPRSRARQAPVAPVAPDVTTPQAASGSDLLERGSLDHVIEPGEDLPVQAVSRAPRAR